MDLGQRSRPSARVATGRVETIPLPHSLPLRSVRGGAKQAPSSLLGQEQRTKHPQPPNSMAWGGTQKTFPSTRGGRLRTQQLVRAPPSTTHLHHGITPASNAQIKGSIAKSSFQYSSALPPRTSSWGRRKQRPYNTVARRQRYQQARAQQRQQEGRSAS